MALASSKSSMERAKNALSMAASVAASAMVARTLIKEFLPHQVRGYIIESLSNLRYLVPSSNDLTVDIDELKSYSTNEIFQAAEYYLSDKVTKRLRAYKHESNRKILVTANQDEVIKDVFDGVEYRWRLSYREVPRRRDNELARSFELSFHHHHRQDLVTYLTHLIETWKAVMAGERQIQLYSLRQSKWNPVNLDHKATFDNLAMDPELKNMVMADLERFVRSRDYYCRVGRAWKRGYLLYGPPGTGKSSLIGAMANYLHFDIYDLELTEVKDNSSLRTVLMGTTNRSILVVEDIDCSIQLKDRTVADWTKAPVPQDAITLSGMLNMMDGLTSSCGDERIIVLTTNHKERLDPALLRPGRMDLHIHMSYCTLAVFRILAENYHGHVIKDHRLFSEIERLIEEVVDVTPAEVIGELMKSMECDKALEFLLDFLMEKLKDPKRKKGRAETDAHALVENQFENKEERRTINSNEELEENKTKILPSFFVSRCLLSMGIVFCVLLLCFLFLPL